MNYLATWLPFQQITSKTLLVMESVNFFIVAGWTASDAALMVTLRYFLMSIDINILFHDGPKIFNRVEIQKGGGHTIHFSSFMP